MREARPLFPGVTACLVTVIISTSLAWPLSLEDVMIDDSEVGDVCDKIEGEYPVSIQPGVQFRMAGDGEAGVAIYGDPKEKQYQSFSCGGTQATVYYYEYGSPEDLERHLDGIKMVLWGERGPTRLHPELVLEIDNILVVISSRSPDFFANLLSHRMTFPDLGDRAVEDRLHALRCGSGESTSSDLCSALRDFKNGAMPEDLLGKEVLLFGRSWEVSKDARFGPARFEALYVGQTPQRATVASFGAIEPENDDERAQILMQMKAQAAGEVAEAAEPLLAFARDAFGGTKAQARRAGDRSLAFIGMGNRIYLRRSGTRIILTTDLMHHGKDRPFVVAVFTCLR
jgi:hypothetical protein